MSYIPKQSSPPWALYRGSASNRWNDLTDTPEHSFRFRTSGISSSGLTSNYVEPKPKAFTRFQPSWKRPFSTGTLASYKTYATADQSEVLHVRTDNAGDSYGGIDDVSYTPNNDMVFSAYSVFSGGWSGVLQFYPQRSSGIIWWFK